MSAACDKCGTTIPDGDGRCSACGYSANDTEPTWKDDERYRDLLEGSPLPGDFKALVNSFANRSFILLANSGRIASGNMVYAPLSLLNGIGMLISSSEQVAARQVRRELWRCTRVAVPNGDWIEDGFASLFMHLEAIPKVSMTSAGYSLK